MLNKKIHLLIVINMIFFYSCSTSKVRADNDFLAYYNTFYSAETSFEKAQKIIDSSPPNVEISKSTIELLDLAIKNSDIIIDKHYNTQYIDDAYYIIARSSLYKDKLTVAKYYFERIINDFSNSEYFFESHIWLGFIELKFGNYDDLNVLLKYLKDNESYINELSIYYLLLAQSFQDFEYDDTNIQEQYALAIKFEKEPTKKIKLFLELIDIAEKNEDYQKVIQYVSSINELSQNDLDQELLDKWFDGNRMLGNYDIIYKEIDDIILTEQLIDKDRIYYYLQLSRTLLEDNQLVVAEQVVNDLIVEFENNRAFKVELCEFYYYLGIIYMKEYSDYSNAKTYFDLSVQSTTSKNNKYKNASEKKSEFITEYKSLLEEYNYLKENSDEPNFESINNDATSNNPFNNIPMPDNYTLVDEASKDSLLYKMAEISYYEFNNMDTTMDKLMTLIEKYPQSSLVSKSMYFLSKIDTVSNLNWYEQLTSKYPNSIYVDIDNQNINDVIQLRNSAWDALNISYFDSVKLFQNIYQDYNDPISLYSIAFIYENYIKDISECVKYYKLFINNFPDHYLHIESQKNIDQIYNNLESEINFINQQLGYCNSVNMLKLDSIYVDSIMIVIDEGANGRNIKIKDQSYELVDKLAEYNESLEYYNNYMSNEFSEDQINRTNLDKNIYDMLKIFLVDFENRTKTREYYANTIKEISNESYILDLYIHLNLIFPDAGWDSLLYTLEIDSMIVLEMLNETKIEKLFNIDCDLNKLSFNKQRYNDMNNTLFPEFNDTTSIDNGNLE